MLEAIKSILKTESRYLLEEFGVYTNFEIARTYFPLITNTLVPKRDREKKNNLKFNHAPVIEEGQNEDYKTKEKSIISNQFNEDFQRRHLGSFILYISLYYDQTTSNPRKTLIDPTLSRFKELIHEIPFLFYPEDAKVEEIKNILSKFVIRNNFTFDLSFDPDFEKITHNEGYSNLFRTSGKEVLSSIYQDIL